MRDAETNLTLMEFFSSFFTLIFSIFFIHTLTLITPLTMYNIPFLLYVCAKPCYNRVLCIGILYFSPHAASISLVLKE